MWSLIWQLQIAATLAQPDLPGLRILFEQTNPGDFFGSQNELQMTDKKPPEKSDPQKVVDTLKLMSHHWCHGVASWSGKEIS